MQKKFRTALLAFPIFLLILTGCQKNYSTTLFYKKVDPSVLFQELHAAIKENNKKIVYEDKNQRIIVFSDAQWQYPIQAAAYLNSTEEGTELRIKSDVLGGKTNFPATLWEHKNAATFVEPILATLSNRLETTPDALE